ncbi:N-acetylmuramic acid 6-phosphate etherase [Bosea sp. (in: a-proteobacteria)]|jgi:N-acetylmuramic acid 6-phosphate etherase|uniref:N-acetylmuramic acid 6-phosphate etherase n=1 Tax=Bosea sp. (in: a-proteobacteria) TaxID=1871050 RepID=UPI003F6F6464
MPTEDVSARFRDLDAWGDLDILKALYEGQLAAAAAVASSLPAIAEAVAAALPRLEAGGRLIYAGAGTSGRIGVQDGAELTPTFDWPESRLAFAIAGGDGAILHAVENAEDSVDDGAGAMRRTAVGPDDVVIGIAASGRTPYTLAAIGEAKARGALTIGIANNRGSALLRTADHGILTETGEEVVAGSTRMKAGTAQKIVLNLFSTLLMIRLGRVYRGLMVHMRATNAKLRLRAAQMVDMITGCGMEAAARHLDHGGGEVKRAVLLASGADGALAEMLLVRHRGNLRLALLDLGVRPAEQARAAP